MVGAGDFPRQFLQQAHAQRRITLKGLVERFDGQQQDRSRSLGKERVGVGAYRPKPLPIQRDRRSAPCPASPASRAAPPGAEAGPKSTRYNPLHEADWWKMTSPAENAHGLRGGGQQAAGGRRTGEQLRKRVRGNCVQSLRSRFGLHRSLSLACRQAIGPAAPPDSRTPAGRSPDELNRTQPLPTSGPYASATFSTGQRLFRRHGRRGRRLSVWVSQSTAMETRLPVRARRKQLLPARKAPEPASPPRGQIPSHVVRENRFCALHRRPGCWACAVQSPAPPRRPGSHP